MSQLTRRSFGCACHQQVRGLRSGHVGRKRSREGLQSAARAGPGDTALCTGDESRDAQTELRGRGRPLSHCCLGRTRDGTGGVRSCRGRGPRGARAGIQGGEAGGAGRGARTAESPGVSRQPR